MTTLRQPRDRRFVAASAALLGLSVALGPTAYAGSSPPAPFVIDGMIADTTTTFLDPSGNTQELGPLNSNATKLGVIHSASTPMLATTNPNSQVDLTQVWLDTANDADGDTWLYLAWKRDANKGSGVIQYEFMKSAAPTACDYTKTTAELIATCNPFANRAPGDFVIVWDQSGSSARIILRTWSDPDGGTWTKGQPLSLSSGVDLTNISAFAKYSADLFSGEAAVNLSDTVFPANPSSCTSIGNVVPGTVTGNSDTADYKDIVLADFADSLTISNCGTVKVIKDTDPEGGTGPFDYQLAREGGAAIRFDGTTQATGALAADGSEATILALKPGTNYVLTETDMPAAYELQSISCDAPGASDGSPLTVTAGETTTCTITNTLRPGKLTVTKHVVNDNGGTKVTGDFSFKVGTGSAQSFPGTGTQASVSLTVVAGTYNVTEPGADTGGYTTTYSNCSDVKVPPGGTQECTITNDDQPAHLIVTKVIHNDHGLTKTATDFSYSINGQTAISFEADASNDNTVNAGTYTVTEPQANTGGYLTSYSAGCTGIVLALGETKTCTITNSDTPATPAGTTTMRWVLHDSLAITGLRAGAPDAATATATFRLYSDASCTVQVGDAEIRPVASSAASTVAGVAVTAVGTYSWRVTYSGDAYNTGFTTACGSEVTTIGATYTP